LILPRELRDVNTLGMCDNTDVACLMICTRLLEGHAWDTLGFAFRIHLVGIPEAALDRLKVSLQIFAVEAGRIFFRCMEGVGIGNCSSRIHSGPFPLSLGRMGGA